LWSHPLSHDGIDHNWAELLHEIEGQIGSSVAVSMQIANVGVKADHVTASIQVVMQQRVTKAEHGIDGISRRTPNATRERERLFDQVREHAEIRCGTVSFMTAEDIQVIKGWLDQTGDGQEQIYDVVWSGDRGPSDSDSVYRFSSLVGLICHSDPLMRRSMTVLSPPPQGFSPMPGMCDTQSLLMPRGGACCTYLTVPARLAGVTSPAQDSGSYAAVEPVEGLTAHGTSGYTAGMGKGPLPCWNA
jgi:hypothetical protein